MIRNWRVSLFALFVLTSTVVPAAADDRVLPGDLVYRLDPVLDLTSTRSDWETPVMGNGDCAHPPQPIIHAPLVVKPFTAAEVVALAKAAGRWVPPPNGKPGPGRVRIERGLPVSPEEYAAQLNYIEHFLAQYGYSLRDEHARETVARLRPRDVACTPLSVPSLKPAKLDWHVWANYIDKGDPMLERAERRTYEPVRTANQRRSRSHSLEQWWNVKGDRWISASLDMKALDSMVVKDLGAGKFLFNAPGGVGVAMPMRGDCGGLGNPKTEPVCGDGDDQAQCHPSDDATETVKGGVFAASACTKKSDCLRNGDFVLNMTPWEACLGQRGGFHGWFGAESCIVIKSQNEGQKGVFSLSDALGMRSKLIIFTFPLNLVDTQASARYTTANGASAPPPTVGGLLPSLNESTIDGPSATLPIGPLLLAITSKLTVTVDAGKLTPKATPPPPNCPHGMTEILSITGSASASSSASFDAAFTAYVATAGVTGIIDFTHDELSGSIKTEADLGGNLVRVTPAMSYDTQRGDGRLQAYVEVDLFIKKKRWSIELARWDGFNPPPQNLGDKVGLVAACPDPKIQCGGAPN